MITLITNTGGRPIPFSLCQRWMEAQTYGGKVRWVIVDDCDPPTPIDFEKEGWTLEVIRPDYRWQEGDNTQARSLEEALKVIDKDERVVIIEDDDYYAPTYLDTIEKALRRYDLVGEAESRYFNVATDTYRYCGNTQHASLCSTAMKGAALERFREVVSSAGKFIDMKLWKEFRGSRRLYTWDLTCGIKGLPGRGGIGIGHRMVGLSDRNMLKEWIGKDARWYGKG